MNTSNQTLIKGTGNSGKNNKPEKPEVKPESVQARLSRVDGLIDAVIVKSATHAQDMLTAVVEAVLLAADIGIAKYEPLNRLWNNVSVGDQAAISAFIRRLKGTDGYNFKTVNDSGKEVVNSFFKFTVKAGFFPFPTEKGSDNHKTIVGIRNRITEAGVDGLRLIGFGGGNETARNLEKEFDVVDVTTRFLSQLVRNGMKAEAFEFQRAASAMKIPVSKATLEKVANDMDPDKKIEKAKAQIAKQEAVKARLEKRTGASA